MIAMPGVLVKYRGPSAARGTRWVARDADHYHTSRVYPRDHALSPEEDALRVGRAYAEAMGLRWLAGATRLGLARAGRDTYLVFPLEWEGQLCEARF